MRLAEMNDLASATSSASTKLFLVGLRYVEYFETRLVRDALLVREVLFEAEKSRLGLGRPAPHEEWPF